MSTTTTTLTVTTMALHNTNSATPTTNFATPTTNSATPNPTRHRREPLSRVEFEKMKRYYETREGEKTGGEKLKIKSGNRNK